MPRRKPHQMREAGTHAVKHGPVPLAAQYSQRVPSWMRAAEGVRAAAELNEAIEQARRNRRESRFCEINGRTKRRYATEIAAGKAVVRARSDARRTGEKKEARWYPCTRCQGFHLTSQPLREDPTP